MIIAYISSQKIVGIVRILDIAIHNTLISEQEV